MIFRMTTSHYILHTPLLSLFGLSLDIVKDAGLVKYLCYFKTTSASCATKQQRSPKLLARNGQSMDLPSVTADQLALGKDVSLHGFLQVFLRSSRVQV